MPPLLLRLLLCLCLLVDTVGPAMAATHLALSPDKAAAAPADHAPADCHGDEAAAADREPRAPSPAPVDEDCLERCLELCLQHGVADLPMAGQLPPPARAMTAAPRVATQIAHAHAFPPLRPPIG